MSTACCAAWRACSAAAVAAASSAPSGFLCTRRDFQRVASLAAAPHPPSLPPRPPPPPRPGAGARGESAVTRYTHGARPVPPNSELRGHHRVEVGIAQGRILTNERHTVMLTRILECFVSVQRASWGAHNLDLEAFDGRLSLASPQCRGRCCGRSPKRISAGHSRRQAAASSLLLRSSVTKVNHQSGAQAAEGDQAAYHSTDERHRLSYLCDCRPDLLSGRFGERGIQRRRWREWRVWH